MKTNNMHFSNGKTVLLTLSEKIHKQPILCEHEAKGKMYYLFLRIGVSLGSRSLIGGVILVMPITLTIDLRAPRIEPNTSGYSSPRYS